MPEHMKGGPRKYNKRYNKLRTKTDKDYGSSERFNRDWVNSVYRLYDYQ